MVATVSVSDTSSRGVTYNNVDGNEAAKYLFFGGLVVVGTIFLINRAGKGL